MDNPETLNCFLQPGYVNKPSKHQNLNFFARSIVNMHKFE